jgi:transposase-like protein
VSGVQDFMKRVLPEKWAANMEAESRSWMMKCPNCGAEQSVWDTGGIRWKASGNPRQMRRCPKCGTTALQTIYKKLEA